MQTQNAIDYIKEHCSFNKNERYQWLRELIDLTLGDKITDDKIEETVKSLLKFEDEEIDIGLPLEEIEENEDLQDGLLPNFTDLKKHFQTLLTKFKYN